MKQTIHKERIIAKDDRGMIVELALINCNITSLIRITSKKGAVRANHYHRQDIHVTYLISGLMRYSEQKLGTAKKVSRLVRAGELVISKPRVVHAMEFLRDSQMLVLTTESRRKKDYERDTVRIKLV